MTEKLSTESKSFTPGPWSYDADEEEVHADEWQQSDGDPAHICALLGPRKAENAALIAAAPEMLLGLRVLRAMLQAAGLTGGQEAAEQLIAKAEGRQ